MATMVKEKRKEKKKTKVKGQVKKCTTSDLSLLETASDTNTYSDTVKSILQDTTFTIYSDVTTPEDNDDETKTFETEHTYTSSESDEYISSSEITAVENVTSTGNIVKESNKAVLNSEQTKELCADNESDIYKDLNKQLENIKIPKSSFITDVRAMEIEHPDAYLCVKNNKEESLSSEKQIGEIENAEIVIEATDGISQEDSAPSAPIFEEKLPVLIQYIEPQEAAPIPRDKEPSLTLDEATKLFGEREMEEIKIMSEREEAIVEEGPTSGPDHPLVDLLSTFKSSLLAVQRESIIMTQDMADQEKAISKLWKVEKRNIIVTKQCDCGTNVEFLITYEDAELQQEKLPVMQLKLQGLREDLQSSYCHHQHEALLAYYQIEDIISGMVQSNKSDIREALSLLLQALRHSDGASELYANALQSWAGTLTSVLVDKRDVRHLLFVLHHLYRQTLSVQWAVGAVNISIEDSVGAAQAIALLDILLTRSRLETALECTEDTEEVWEEVDKHGDGGAVSEGNLRERDLLSLLYAFPLRDLIARLVLFTNADLKNARECDWVDVHGGRGVLKACCGVRVLLATLQRAATLHAQYTRLLSALRDIGARALLALACFNLNSSYRYPYSKEIQKKITSELEAAFAQGFVLCSTEDTYKLPATLLSEETVREYCNAFIVGLHDKSPRRIEALSIESSSHACDMRVCIVAQAAIDRTHDHQLAKIVLEFLFQGLKSKKSKCAGGCEAYARDWIPLLLAAHSYLHTLALHMVAEMNHVEPIEPENVKALSFEMWRPTTGECRAVLQDWSQRAPQLLQYLLLGLNYTPYTGLPLEVQLIIGSFLCTWVRSSPSHSSKDWHWDVLRMLRVHRSWWNVPLEALPPDEEPTDNFSIAYTLLATSWGHCIPLICSQGVPALCTLAAVRVRDAVHCLAPIMIVMAHSPESVSLTPKFNELFTIILNSGPSLVQRALGRGGVSGSMLLLQLILKQLEIEANGLRRGSILSVWMHSLWQYSLPTSSIAILDTVACACRDWPRLDAHAIMMLQEENSKFIITQAIRNASTAPLLCDCILRACQANEDPHMHSRLLTKLVQQRMNGQKIHVDNALQQLGANMNSEDLAIYRSATAAMAAPVQHPSHLALWRQFMHLYLQRPPDYMSELAPAVGPLFYSGLIKSITLNQIKKRLQDVTTYHFIEAETLKNRLQKSINPKDTATPHKTNAEADDRMLLGLSMNDFTGQTSVPSEESESSGEDGDTDNKESSTDFWRMMANLLIYHESADKLISEYSAWIEEGENVQAMPHMADIARFIPHQALEASWQNALFTSRPSLDTDCETPTTPSESFPPVPVLKSPFEIALDSINGIKVKSRKSIRGIPKSPLEDLDFKDSRKLMRVVDEYLNDVNKLGMEWCQEALKIRTLDDTYFKLVRKLRVRKQLPILRKMCPKKCKLLTLHVPQSEWCISTAAENEMKENRSKIRSYIRRLSRPRPTAARTVATLHIITRRIDNKAYAKQVLEKAWACMAEVDNCAPAQGVLTFMVTYLAENWICQDEKLCSDLLIRWSKYSRSVAQQQFCGAIISPQRLRPEQWPKIYKALLTVDLCDQMLFSYLSKFDMVRWSETATPDSRRELLNALTAAIQRWGSKPEPRFYVVLDLLHMHIRAIISENELCSHIITCTKASVNATLPHQHWNHVANALEKIGDKMDLDQLDYILHELGDIWWHARNCMDVQKQTEYASYSPYIANLLKVLIRALVAAALKLTYTPERVCSHAWSSIHKSWYAWIAPSLTASPMLTALGHNELYTSMLKRFVDTLHQVMFDCPDSEIYLLQHVFLWIIQTHLSVQSVHVPQETCVQMSTLLAEVAKLPWTEHQWCYGNCLASTMQICTSTDKEILAWCCQTWRNITAETWMLGDDNSEQDVARKLAALLFLFTGNMPHEQHTLEEATRLPWWRLPEQALCEAMDRFFVIHHNPATPYHELPQFKVLLFASELCVHPHTPASIRASTHSRQKRCVAVSQLLRAASSPTLKSHVAGFSTMILNLLTQLASSLENSSDVIEELLGRAIQIMCMEPAATVLPVWEQWVRNAPSAMVRACVSAASVLTAFEYFASIADAAIKTFLSNKENGSWDEVVSRLTNSPWKEPHALLSGGRLHAAYACAVAHAQAQDVANMRKTFSELRAININFPENEAIVAVWICYACRIALLYSRVHSTEMADCLSSVNQLVGGWANPPRRSILKVVALQADDDRPTHNQRLICRLAQCILSPNDESLAIGFESACVGPISEMSAWGRNPTLDRLVRLSVALYPQYERYFKIESELSKE